jgi:hypothetical protein
MRRRAGFLLAAIGLALAGAIAACGSSSATGGGPGDASVDATADALPATSPDASSDASSPATDGGPDDAAAVSDGACPTIVPCPSAEPEAGTPCDGHNVACEYGDDPRLINHYLGCAGGQWTRLLAPSFATDASPDGAAPPALPPGCPATLADVDAGAACPALGQSCFYGGGECYCIGAGDAGLVWRCVVPAASCPATRPRLGTACSGPSTKCDYALIDCSGSQFSASLHCACGAWVSAPNAFCPPPPP